MFGSKEAGERTKSSEDTNITRGDELLNNKDEYEARIRGRKSYLADPVAEFPNRSQFQEEIHRLLVVSLSKVGKGACKIELCLSFIPFLGFPGCPRAWNHGSCRY